MKIFSRVLKLKSGHDFHRKNIKGHNSVKMKVALGFFFFVHRLMMVYICIKFHENILDGIKIIERT